MGRVGLKLEQALVQSEEEMIAFGKTIASQLRSNEILALSGNLGAGKTTFVKGIALGLGIREPIQSPTFVLLNLYEGLAHFDLYRLKTESDFISLGFDEYFTNTICAIEWPERIGSLLPPHTIRLDFEHTPEGRVVRIR